jgi:hypothetical protein
MATQKRFPTLTGNAARTRPAVDPVDDMMARYVQWREDAAGVAEAYALWRAAPRAEAAWRFSAYLAALRAEEASAGSYALAVADVVCSLERGLSGKGPPRVLRSSAERRVPTGFNHPSL